LGVSKWHIVLRHYTIKNKNKNRPPDLEKIKWVDAKQVIFFMWPNVREAPHIALPCIML
jgi:hypothetical protein